MLVDQVFDHKGRCAHFNAQGFCFLAARNRAAVIIGKYNNRFVAKSGIETPLARHVKIIAINQGNHNLGLKTSITAWVTVPQTVKSIPSSILRDLNLELAGKRKIPSRVSTRCLIILSPSRVASTVLLFMDLMYGSLISV